MARIAHTPQRGFAAIAAAIIAAVAIIATAAAYYVATQNNAPQEPAEEQSEQETIIKREEAATAKTAPIPAADDAAMKDEHSGTVLAGESAPLLDFTQADFDAAVSSGKLTVLYFYANWCPICVAEFPQMQQAFNELTTDQIIGFRVNFNDGQTDVNEKELARQQGVAYQHTKVFLKDGRQTLKSPESWTLDRYRAEIAKAASQ